MNSEGAAAPLTAQVEEYFFDIAVHDASACLDTAERTGAPRDRRSAVRAVFAFVDGCHEFVRGYVRDQAFVYSHAYSVSDLAVLREESPYVDERGNVKVRPLRVPLITSIKALVKLLEQNSAAENTVDLTHPGFAALMRAVDVRNRIVHPKKAGDLDVSDMDMENVRLAFRWYLSFALRMSYATSEALRALAETYGVKPQRPLQG